MDYLERAKLINKVIEDGHEIIDKMRPISKLSELEKLEPIIDKYADFVDENFGEPLDFSDEKDFEPTQVLAKDFMNGFIEELDGESWI